MFSKKELLKEFSQLNDKRMALGYKMVISKTKEEIKKVMSEFEENGAIPILLVFNREEKN